MAARPSPKSDAKIRDQYRRGLRRSARAQEIAEDLERTGVGETLAISRWNRGEDPALNTLSRANAAVAARGFSAASADRGRAMQAVNEALQAEPSSDLPPVAREMYGRRRDRLIGNAEEFLRDADEYSGRRAGNYNIGVRKPSATPAEPEPEATGRISVSRPKKTYLDELAGTEGTIETETFNAADEARKYQEQQFERAKLLDKLGQAGRARGAEVEANRLKNQLREKGISPDAAYTRVEKTYLDELSGTKGTSTGFDANKARGLLSAATFQGWEDDKALTVRAEKLRQAEERKLRNLRSYEDTMGGRLNPEQAQQLADAIFDTEANIDDGKKNPGGLLTRGFWRAQAEENDAADAERRVATLNIEKANQATVKSIRENSKTLSEQIDALQIRFENGEITEEQMRTIMPQLIASYS